MNELVGALRRVLITFGCGLGLLSLVVGLVSINDEEGCGSLFSHDYGCAGTNARLTIFLVLLGLGITCFLAAVFIERPMSAVDRDPSSDLIDTSTPFKRARLGDEQARLRARKEARQARPDGDR